MSFQIASIAPLRLGMPLGTIMEWRGGPSITQQADMGATMETPQDTMLPLRGGVMVAGIMAGSCGFQLYFVG